MSADDDLEPEKHWWRVRLKVHVAQDRCRRCQYGPQKTLEKSRRYLTEQPTNQDSRPKETYVNAMATQTSSVSQIITKEA